MLFITPVTINYSQPNSASSSFGSPQQSAGQQTVCASVHYLRTDQVLADFGTTEKPKFQITIRKLELANPITLDCTFTYNNVTYSPIAISEKGNKVMAVIG